jgi:two-component system, OmpR family, KDP operon response regulator KdpE
MATPTARTRIENSGVSNAMENTTILVIDDEPQIRRVLRTTLCNAGYTLIEANNGPEAVELFCREHPDLILLDVNIPGLSGLEVCRKIRVSFEGPIIMLSVRDAVRDRIEGLDSGANDYVVKPFAMEELLARIRAALRDSRLEKLAPRLETPELTVDFDARLVTIRGARIHLTPKEFDVLRVLMLEPGKVIASRRILQVVWGPEYGEEAEKVHVVIGQLRKKLEQDPADPRYIITEPWIGYKFQLPHYASGTARRKS